MTPEIKKLEDSIKKIHRVAFTPKFKDSFHTKLSKSAFIAIAIKVIEKIGWELVFYDEATVEAKKKNEWDTFTEGISIKYDLGKVHIQSTSLGNDMWDFGRNSKRVKLFQLVLNQLELELSDEEITAFETEQKKVDEWEDYTVPKSLPAPTQNKKPNIYVPLLGSFLVAILLGYILAFTISKGFYIIGLFDVGVGFVIGFTLAQLVKLGNYTDFKKLRIVLVVSVLISFLTSQYFIYQFHLSEAPLLDTDFISFMKLRFEAGLTIRSLNTGWIGLVISWGFLLFFGYYIGLVKLIGGILKHQLNRIPTEVLDYTIYLFIKENSEDEVRIKLSKMGWTDSEDQDSVLEAVEAVGAATEIRRS
jgi:hypothetical protein